MSFIRSGRPATRRPLSESARIVRALRGLARRAGVGVVYEQCETWDSACVARNQALNDQTLVATQAGQAQNNYDLCLQNAANAATPEQYAETISRCNGQYSIQAPTNYTPQAWTPVEWNQPVNLVYGPAPVAPNTSAPLPDYVSPTAPAPVAPIYVAPAPAPAPKPAAAPAPAPAPAPARTSTTTTTPGSNFNPAPPPPPADPNVVSTPLTSIGKQLQLPASMQPVLAAADSWPWYYWAAGAALAYLLGRKQHA